MLWTTLLTAALSAATALGLPGRDTHRQTLEEAAEWTRHVLDHRADGMATLASDLPANFRVADLAGRPHAMLEYFAPGPANGSLYLLLMPISQTVHNVLVTDSKNVTLTFKDEEGERRSRKGEGATDRARMTLWGSVVLIPNDSEDAKAAKRQYLKYHPDAVAYAPPIAVHNAQWAIFNPTHCYFIGGFGDIHYIGYIPYELYKSRGKKEEVQERQEVQEQQAFAIQESRLWKDW